MCREAVAGAVGMVLDGMRIAAWPLRPFMRMPLRLPVVVGLLYTVLWLVYLRAR